MQIIANICKFCICNNQHNVEYNYKYHHYYTFVGLRHSYVQRLTEKKDFQPSDPGR